MAIKIQWKIHRHMSTNMIPSYLFQNDLSKRTRYLTLKMLNRNILQYPFINLLHDFILLIDSA